VRVCFELLTAKTLTNLVFPVFIAIYLSSHIITVVVVLVVVYVTGLSKQTEINEELMYYEESPTSSPTKSPITDREESGIIEQLEGGVLVRNETFDEMKKGDPRYWHWIGSCTRI